MLWPCKGNHALCASQHMHQDHPRTTSNGGKIVPTWRPAHSKLGTLLPGGCSSLLWCSAAQCMTEKWPSEPCRIAHGKSNLPAGLPHSLDQPIHLLTRNGCNHKFGPTITAPLPKKLGHWLGPHINVNLFQVCPAAATKKGAQSVSNLSRASTTD